MIVKDVTRLAKELDKACKKGQEVLGVNLDYVGDKGIKVHMTAKAFIERFNEYTVSAQGYTFLYRAANVIDGVTYFALLTQKEINEYGIDINGTEDR